MITLSLDAPEPWGSHLRAAAATWPAGIVIHSDDSTRPTVHAVLRDPHDGVRTIAAVAEGTIHSQISSRQPIPTPRLTAWARRHVARLPGIASLDWPGDEDVHETPLALDASAVRATRREVATRFGGWSRADDLVLAASELAANAVQHGGGPSSLVVRTGGGGVVIEVGDHAARLAPVVLPLRPITSTGRGLAIVDVITDCWGVLALPAGKIVWCEFFDLGRSSIH
jgi:hypothetical protein